MTVGPVIDVLVGLIFMFFVFSMLSSGINEYIARSLQKRVDFLAAGISQLLEDAAYTKRFWSHPLVTQLGQSLEGTPRRWRHKLWAKVSRLVERALSTRTGKAARLQRIAAESALPEGEDRRLPSYIPTATFVAVLQNITEDTPPAENTPLQRSLDALKDNDPAQQRRNWSRWFDDQMDRVSGWYKRDSKTILFALASVIAVAMNVDTITVARTLWRDPTTRKVVADAAQAQLEAAQQTTTTAAGGGAAPAPTSPPAASLQVICKKAGPPTGGSTTTTSAEDALRGSIDCATQFPIGWRISKACFVNRTQPPEACKGVLAHPVDIFWSAWRRPFGALLKLMGLFMTAAALSFGAPFWFDLLNRFGNLRSTGAKPPPATTTTGGS